MDADTPALLDPAAHDVRPALADLLALLCALAPVLALGAWAALTLLR